jgi:hypothetical protein
VSKTHLYNSKIGKVRWFVKRFGAREVAMKPLRTIFAPLIIARLLPKTFQFHGRELPLLYHRYNMTWASERCVEVPIARYYAESAIPERTLEVGNVLSHYGPVKHEIIDKFEKASGVINEDITSFRPGKGYDLILSISTFEHIGFDDEAEGKSADKILSAIGTCRRLLAPSGRLVITVPISYNPELNELINSGKLGANGETFLKKYRPQDWRECPKEEAMRCKYKEPFSYANAVMVAEFGV